MGMEQDTIAVSRATLIHETRGRRLELCLPEGQKLSIPLGTSEYRKAEVEFTRGHILTGGIK
jgi:hypothetical protein